MDNTVFLFQKLRFRLLIQIFVKHSLLRFRLRFLTFSRLTLLPVDLLRFMLLLLIVEVHSLLLIWMLIIMQRVLIFSMHSQLQYGQLRSQLQLLIDVKLFQQRYRLQYESEQQLGIQLWKLRVRPRFQIYEEHSRFRWQQEY